MTTREKVVSAVVAAFAVFTVGYSTSRVLYTNPYIPTINPGAESGAADAAPRLNLTLGAQSCGSERAAVKHLTDGFVLPAQPTVMTPDQLVALAAPAVTPSSPRFTSVPAGSLPETTLVELVNVHVIAVKQEADSDLHVIIATSTGAELNVEAPMAACDSASPYAAQLAAARAAMDKAMPGASSSSYTPENLTATIEGVVFYDVLHGQRGAPNGVELHPLLYFSATGSGPPITTPTPTTTVTAPPVTTGPMPTTTSTVTSALDSDHVADPIECGTSAAAKPDSDYLADATEC